MKRFAYSSKYLFLSVFALFTIAAFAQPKQHVAWSYSVKQLSDCEFELQFKATIEKGWHLYSQIPVDNGPLPTEFLWDKSADYELVGKTSEPKPIEKPEPVFDNQVIKYFEDVAVFKQKIRVKTDKEFSITGAIDGMVCNDGACVNFFPQPQFKFTVKGKPCAAGTGQTTPVNGTTGSVAGSNGASGCCDSLQAVIATLQGSGSGDTNATTADTAQSAGMAATDTDTETSAPATLNEGSSIWTAFGGGFLGGLLALITPCVFPMIPMTVSFFTKRAKDRKKGIRDAIIYGLSIVAIYVSLGLLVTLATGDPQVLNQLSANIWFNLIFFAVFIVFGVSFLGAFEITLPSSFVNKVDAASDKGGLIGIFFMAFTLSLVSFSCTGPIVGTALVQATQAGITGPLFVMLGFSIALALPFMLFALFPGWLSSLPKSGGWLNSVKVVMGLLEFALALKFLSNVDLSYHWGIVTREVFIAVWVVCFSLIGFYLLGKLKFSHDSDLPYISVPRIVFAIITFSFVIYITPGMWGAPVRALSGILPPAYYSENAGTFAGGGGSKSGEDALPEGVDPSHCPLNLNCFHDYDLGLAYAKKVNKPIFVDFTGYNCANCRRMEDNVWPEPDVLTQLQKDYVVISLYCDDKKELPEDKKYTTKDGVKIRTWGNKWSQMQIDRYGSNAQPLYVLLDHNEKTLLPPQPYTPDANEYANFLRKGSANFKKRSGN